MDGPLAPSAHEAGKISSREKQATAEKLSRSPVRKRMPRELQARVGGRESLRGATAFGFASISTEAQRHFLCSPWMVRLHRLHMRRGKFRPARNKQRLKSLAEARRVKECPIFSRVHRSPVRAVTLTSSRDNTTTQWECCPVSTEWPGPEAKGRRRLHP